MTVSPRLVAATLLIVIVSSLSPTIARRSLVEIPTSSSTTTTDDGSASPSPSSTATQPQEREDGNGGGDDDNNNNDDAGSNDGGDGNNNDNDKNDNDDNNNNKCVDEDDVINLRWPKTFTPPLTTPEQRARAVSPLDHQHDRRLLLKLGPVLLGEREKLVIGTIGGSVTTGFRPDHLDYPTQFAEGLRESLTAMAPDKRWAIESRNGAQGGTGSGYFALCVNRHMASDTDLALVELNVNDGTDRAYERVHRKILARGAADAPAMVEVLVENWTEREAGEIPVIPGDRWKTRLPVLNHYRIPYVTQAEALAPEVERDSTSKKERSGRPYDILEWLDSEDVRDIREHYFISLGKHMLKSGHQMMAEMLMEMVMILVRKHGGCKSTLRAAMARAKADEEEFVKAGGVGGKAPYYPNIVERHTESCATPKQIMHMSRAEGWSLKDERSSHGEHKFGVIATKPGSWLNISLDTRANLGGMGGGGGGSGGLDGVEGGGGERGDSVIDDSHTMVTIAYLASYEHMGRVKGSCGGGCKCDEFTIDALWERESSELQLHHVRTEPPAEHCHVNLRLDEGTNDKNQEHKFKVLQVTVQEDFVEGKRVAGHEEGGLMNNFKDDDIANFGEAHDEN